MYPNDGARKLNARLWFFYAVTGITPAMCMRLENVGSQYLETFEDADGNPFDGSKTYKVTLLGSTFLRRGSGHSPSMTTRILARCSIHRSVIRAPAARAIRHPPPNPTPMR